MAGSRPGGKTTADGSEQLKEHQPIHLQERDGSLVPVLGYTLEDFDEFLELRNQLHRGQARPRFAIQRLAARGQIKGKYVELDFDVEILVNVAGWVRVPLRLGQAVLVESPRYAGSGKHFVDFEGQAPGYVAWLHGEGEQERTHKVSFKALFPVDSLSGRQRLRFTAPRATQSELKLALPASGAEAQLVGGGVLSTSVVGKESLATVRSLEGDFELSWRPTAGKIVEAVNDLEASGVVLAKLDSRGLRSEAAFTVRSASGDYRFDAFRIRLPAGMNLLPVDQPGVRVSLKQGAAQSQQLAEVQLDEPTTGPVEVRLILERPLNPAQRDVSSELAGFDVIEAVRQYGQLGVQTADDWRVLFEPNSNGVRRVEQLPESLRQLDLAAAYEYAGGASSLKARAVQQPVRVTAEPEYQVRVEADRIWLSAKVRYRVPGAKVFSLDIDLRGWETDGERIGPATLVDQGRIATDALTPLSIPLRQAMKGDFEITIEAWQSLPSAAKSVDFLLPQPIANNLGLAPVVVLPADNISLVVQKESLVGLKPQATLRKSSVTPRQQEPLYFLDDVTQGRFAADFRVIPREVRTSLQSEVAIDERDVRVEQKIAYRVAYVPLDRLMLEVPASLVAGGQLEVLLAGRPLPLSRERPADPDDDPAAPISMLAVLVDETGQLSPRIGPFEVTIRYPLPREQLSYDASVSLDVPLVMPLDAEPSSNALVVTPKPGVSVQLRDGSWQSAPSGNPWSEPASGLRFASSGKSRVVLLAMHLEAERSLEGAIVERAWIQSQLGRTTRQDRAVFRFTSGARSLDVLLPSQIEIKNVTALLNGQTVALGPGVDRGAVVPLAKEMARRPQVLELSYRFPSREPSDRFALEAPTIGGGAWVRRLYWQLLLPGDEHLVLPPEGFTGEFAWSWQPPALGRKPLLSQRDLETWCGGATRHLEPPPAGMNAYLFGSLEAGNRLEVTVMGRKNLVLTASLCALLAGLAVIYLPRARRALLLSAALAVAAGGAIYPEPAAVLLQAGSLGVALSLVAGLLKRLVTRRQGPLAIPRRGGSSIVDRGSGRALTLPALIAGSNSSTKAAALVSPEAKS